MNIATSRFTISTILAAACAMVALVAAEPAHAQGAAPTVQRIEIVGQRIAPTQRIVIVGKRQAEPTRATHRHRRPAPAHGARGRRRRRGTTALGTAV